MAEVEAETVAWGCRQEPHGLPAYVRVSAIGPSDVSGEPSRQQAARPLSWSWSRLWQSPRKREVEEAGCCWILRVLPQLCRRDFVTNFEGWSLDLHHCLACALQHSRESCRDSADTTLGHCALHYYCFVPRAIAVPRLDRYQTIEAQTAANLLGVHDSGYAIPVSTVREEWGWMLGFDAPGPRIGATARPPRPVDLVFGFVWLSLVLWIGHVPVRPSLMHRYLPASGPRGYYVLQCSGYSCRA